jgi:hypothetical protein
MEDVMAVEQQEMAQTIHPQKLEPQNADPRESLIQSMASLCDKERRNLTPLYGFVESLRDLQVRPIA